MPHAEWAMHKALHALCSSWWAHKKKQRLDVVAFFIARWRRLRDCTIFEGLFTSLNLIRRAFEQSFNPPVFLIHIR